MTAAAMQSLVTTTLSSFGTSVLAIVTAVIGVGLAYLVFRFGWRKVKGSLK